ALAGQSINKLLDEAVASMQTRATEHRVAIVSHYEEHDLPAVGGTNLFQVFCNIIKNAIDAMQAGGTLTISARSKGDAVIVAFADTGMGLPADADQLFQPFFTTKPSGEGTGLGLAVCREIIERLGGTISAENRRHVRAP